MSACSSCQDNTVYIFFFFSSWEPITLNSGNAWLWQHYTSSKILNYPGNLSNALTHLQHPWKCWQPTVSFHEHCPIPCYSVSRIRLNSTNLKNKVPNMLPYHKTINLTTFTILQLLLKVTIFGDFLSLKTFKNQFTNH